MWWRINFFIKMRGYMITLIPIAIFFFHKGNQESVT